MGLFLLRSDGAGSRAGLRKRYDFCRFLALVWEDSVEAYFVEAYRDRIRLVQPVAGGFSMWK